MLTDQSWTDVGCWQHTALWQTLLHVSITEKDKLQATEKYFSTFICGLAKQSTWKRGSPGGGGWLMLQPFLSTSWGSRLSSWVSLLGCSNKTKSHGPSLPHMPNVHFGSPGKPPRQRPAPLHKTSARVPARAPSVAPTPWAAAALCFALTPWASRCGATQLTVSSGVSYLRAITTWIWSKDWGRSHFPVQMLFTLAGRDSVLLVQTPPHLPLAAYLVQEVQGVLAHQPWSIPTERASHTLRKKKWSYHLCQQGLLTWLSNDWHTASRSMLLSKGSSNAPKASLYPWNRNDAHFITGVLDITAVLKGIAKRPSDDSSAVSQWCTRLPPPIVTLSSNAAKQLRDVPLKGAWKGQDELPGCCRFLRMGQILLTRTTT